MVNIIYGIVWAMAGMFFIYSSSVIIFSTYFYCKKQYELNLIKEVRKHGKETE